jgi:hypothetical protein
MEIIDSSRPCGVQRGPGGESRVVRASLAPQREHLSLVRISEPRPASLSDFEAVQSPSGPAIPALNLERAAKADQIGSGANMLRGHSPPLGW